MQGVYAAGSKVFNVQSSWMLKGKENPLPDRATARACAGPLHLPWARVAEKRLEEGLHLSGVFVVKLQAEEVNRAPRSPWP